MLELSEKIDNSILILDSPHSISRYTCIVYIFDFVENDYYKNIATYFHIKEVFAGPEFMAFLFKNGYLEEINKIDVTVYVVKPSWTDGVLT